MKDAKLNNVVLIVYCSQLKSFIFNGNDFKLNYFLNTSINTPKNFNNKTIFTLKNI